MRIKDAVVPPTNTISRTTASALGTPLVTLARLTRVDTAMVGYLSPARVAVAAQLWHNSNPC